MPRFTVSDEQGHTLVLEGDSPPTEDELEQIFSSRRDQGPPAPPQAFIPNIANAVQNVVGLSDRVLGLTEQGWEAGKMGRIEREAQPEILQPPPDIVQRDAQSRASLEAQFPGYTTEFTPGKFEGIPFAEMMPKFGPRELAKSMAAFPPGIGIPPRQSPTEPQLKAADKSLPFQLASGATAGIGELAAGIGQYITSEQGALELGLAKTPLAPAVAMKWAHDMVTGGMVNAADAIEAYKSGDMEAFGKHVASGLGQLVGGGIAAKHGVQRARPLVKPSIQAVEEMLPGGKLKRSERLEAESWLEDHKNLKRSIEGLQRDSSTRNDPAKQAALERLQQQIQSAGLSDAHQRILDEAIEGSPVPVEIVWGRPRKPGQYAGMGRNAEGQEVVQFYGEEIPEWLEDVAKHRRKGSAERAIDEEIVHKHVTPEEADLAWADADPITRWIAQKTYGIKVGDQGITTRDMGHEIIRQRVQRMSGGTREAVQASFEQKIDLKALEILEKVVRGVLGNFGPMGQQIKGIKSEASVRQTLANIEAAKAAHERVDVEDVWNPEETGPAAMSKLPADRARYNDLFEKFRTMVDEGKTDTVEFATTWKEIESIKNKYGGMMPEESEAGPAATRKGQKDFQGDAEEFAIKNDLDKDFTEKLASFLAGGKLSDKDAAMAKQFVDQYPEYQKFRGGPAAMSKRAQDAAKLNAMRVAEAQGKEPEKLKGPVMQKTGEVPVAPEERVGATESGAIPSLSATDLDKAASAHLAGEIKPRPLGRARSEEAQKAAPRVSYDRPKFDEFSEWAQRNMEGVKPHQIRDLWQDKVWSELLRATPERLEEWRKALGLESHYGRSQIAEAPPEETTFRLEQEFHEGKRAATRILKEEGKVKGARSRYRNKLVEAIGLKLIGESITERPEMSRSEITIDDIDFENSKTQYGAYRDLSRQEISNKDALQKILRDQSRASSSDPESASRRLVAVVGKDGKVDVLSTYNDAGVQRVTDPTGPKVKGRPHRELNDAFIRQWRPFATVLLSDPVQSFHQRFDSVSEFMDRIGKEASERSRVGEFPGEGPVEGFEAEGTAGLEGEGGMVMGPEARTVRATMGMTRGSLESKTPLTDREVGGIVENILDEVGVFESVADVRLSLDGIQSRASIGRLTPVDRLAISGYAKAFSELERRNPDVDRESLIDMMADKIYESYKQSDPTAPETFVRRALAQFAPQGGEAAGPIPTRQAARTGAKEVTTSSYRKPIQASGGPPLRGVTGKAADIARREAESASAARLEAKIKAIGGELPEEPRFQKELRRAGQLSREAEAEAKAELEAEGLNPAAMSKSITERQNKLIGNFYSAANKAADRTRYGYYTDKVPPSAFIVSWSNGNARWDVHPRRNVEFHTAIGSGMEGWLEKSGITEIPDGHAWLDANQILISAPSLRDAQLIASNLPKHPLYELSAEQNPLFKEGTKLEDIDSFYKKMEGVRMDYTGVERPDVIMATDRFMDKIRSPEQMGPAAMSKRKVERLTEFVKGAGSRYDEWLVDRLERKGGDITAQAMGDARQVIDRSKEFYGSLTPNLDKARMMAGAQREFDIPLTKGAKVALPTPELLKATTWLHGKELVTPFAATRRTVGAIEDTISVPPWAKPLVDIAQMSNLEIGKMLEAVSPGFKASGKFARNVTAYGYDVIRQGTGDAWRKWTAAIAKANHKDLNDARLGHMVKTGVDIGSPLVQVRGFFRDWKETLDTPGVDVAHLERVNQDFSRKYPKVITDIKSNKVWHPVVHADLYNYLENAAQRAAHIRAFRERFPATKAGRAALSDMREAVSRELGPDAIEDLDALLRTLQGHPVDNYSKWGMFAPTRPVGQAFRMANQTVGNVMARSVLSGQMFVQPGENIAGSVPIFLGYKNYARGLAKLKHIYAQLEQQGMVNRVMYDMSFDPSAPTRSVFRIGGNAISKVFMEQLLNELQEGGAAATAHVVAERIKAGTLDAWEKRMLPETFRAMKFTPVEVEAMMKGDANLLDQFKRRAAAFLTSGNKAIAESSSIGARGLEPIAPGGRFFNSIFRFQTYPMMKTQQLRRVTSRFVEAWDKGTPAEKRSATEMLARFAFGGVLQGAITVGITSLAYNNFQGVKIKSQEARDEPIKFMAELFAATMGGPLYLVTRAAMGNGLLGFLEQLARTAFPFAIYQDLTDAAQGAGQYRDLDAWSRIGKFIQNKTPGTKAISTGMAMFGLSQKDKKFEASRSAFYRWYSDEFKRPFHDEPSLDPFRMEMKKAVEAMKEGNRQEFMKAYMAASGESIKKDIDAGRPTTGSEVKQSVASSFRSRKMLKDPEGNPLTREQKQSLRARIGFDAYDRLEYFDLMLEQAADGVLLPKHD